METGTLDSSSVPSDLDLVRLKQRELELLRAQLALVQENGIDFYRPSEKQHLFHSACAKDRGIFAGNRFGKSEASAAEAVAWFVGERSWYKYSFPIYGIRWINGVRTRVLVTFHEGHPDHPLVRQGIPRHSTKQLIIVTEWKKVDEVWTGLDGDNPGKLWKYMPRRAKLRTRRNHEGSIDRIYGEPDSPVGAGSVIRFNTEQAFIKNPQGSESVDYDRIGVDEPIVEDMWKANARGLVDRNGQADFTLTALRERWIYDHFFPDEGGQIAGRWAIRADMDDNPHLTDESIARFMSILTPEEQECRRYGHPLELSGLVYKQFNRAVHVLDTLPAGWSSWTNPPLDWTIYVAIDVHEQTPQAVMFVAVPKVGAPIIYDEIWRACVADELAAEINLRLINRTVGFIKADPRAWNEDPVYRCSMAQRFQLAGLAVEKASKEKSYGIINMQNILAKRVPTPDGRSRPAVFFAPSVRQTLREISRYCFDKENKPVDKDDHFMENMYRLFITPLSHIDATVNRPVPDFDIPMTRSAITDFDNDAAAFNAAVGLRN